MTGLGRKIWGTETLSAAEMQGYLQDQTVMVFPSANVRDTEIPAPTDGMVAYLQDLDVFTERINGAWSDRYTPWATVPLLGNAFINHVQIAANQGAGGVLSVPTVQVRKEGRRAVMRGWSYSSSGHAAGAAGTTGALLTGALMPAALRPVTYSAYLWPRLDGATVATPRFELTPGGQLYAMRAVAAGSYLNWDGVSWDLP